MTTADKIRILRAQKGMTQEQLGRMVGVQRAAINKYEKGTVVNIKRSTLQKLATALGVSPVDLLDDSEQFPADTDLEPVEEQLIEKIRRLPESCQYMVMSIVDEFLELSNDRDTK